MSDPAQEYDAVDILDIHAHGEYLGSDDDLGLVEGVLDTGVLEATYDFYLVLLVDEGVVDVAVEEVVLQEPVDPVGMVDGPAEHQHSLGDHVPLAGLHHFQQGGHFVGVSGHGDYLVGPEQLAYEVTVGVQHLGQSVSNVAVGSGGE